MKQIPWLVAGIIAGYLVGGIGPRREGDALRARIGELEDDALRNARKRAVRSTIVPGLEQMLPQDDEVDAPDLAGEEEPSAEPDPNEPAPPAVAPGGGPSMEEFDAAVAAQRVRVEQTREALRQQADLDDEELAEIDEIALTMNERLAEHAAEVLEIALSGEEPAPRDLLGITHDVTGILYESQTALEEVVGEEALGEVDEEAVVVWNYIDLESFRGAMEELGAAEGGGPGR